MEVLPLTLQFRQCLYNIHPSHFYLQLISDQFSKYFIDYYKAYSGLDIGEININRV